VRKIGKSGVIKTGFFDCVAGIHDVVERFGFGEWNYYVTLNKFDASRFEVANEFRNPKRGGSVGDKDVTRITFLFFDFDPVRPTGRQSTAEQLATAIARAKACREHLAGLGWPEPIIGMSGSGAHIFHRADLPNDDDTRRLLGVLYDKLEARFGDDAVKFDKTARTPSRITKLYDTLVWYPNEPLETERRVSFAVVPTALLTLTNSALMLACADEVPQVVESNKQRKRHAPRRGTGDWKTLDIAGLFKSHDMWVRDEGGGKHVVRCPWRGEHSTEDNGTATVVWEAGSNGKPFPAFNCKHAHCEHRTLSDVARHFSDVDKFCEVERKPAQERAAMSEGEAELASPKRSANEVARLVMAKHSLMQVTLGSMYEYSGSHWQQIDDFRLAQLYSAEEAPNLDVQRRRNEGVNYIKVSTLKRVERWNNLAIDEIPFPEGVYSVKAGTMREHRMEDYLQCIIPRSIDPKAVDMPRWEKCLSDWFCGDVDMAAKLSMMQEFFGQVMLPHNAFKKALILHGDTDTGKSLAIKVLEAMVGEKNVTHLSIANMGDDSACSVLAGKLLNTVNDLGKNERLDDGGFKRLTGGDEIVVNEKYVRRASYRPIASHVIACNTLPKVEDRTEAVYNRLLILTFNHRLRSHEQNKWLFRDLEPELPAILNWAIDGARRLLEVGDFSVCPSSTNMVNGYRHDQNDAWAFISERMVFQDGSRTVTLQEFRLAISEWLGCPPLRPRTVRDMVRSSGHGVVLEGAREVIDGLIWKSSLEY